VFSHFNRTFLYDENVVPIYEQYSIDDSKLKYHRNLDISNRLYNMILKSLRNDIISTTGYNTKEIVNIYNKYPKNRVKLSLLNKSFNKIKIPNDIDVKIPKKTIAFIPDRKESKSKLKRILHHLQDNYNVIVIGDSNIYFQELNDLNKKNSMILYLYKYLIAVLNKVDAVICPLGDWTFLCNLQNIPVFSWGKDLSPYKQNGTYNFNNKCNIISQTTEKNIISGIEYFLRRL